MATIAGITALILQTSAMAQTADPSKVMEIGIYMLEEWMGTADNRLIVREAAQLKACGQDGLAKAVEAKESDPLFVELRLKYQKDGRFIGLEGWAPLVAAQTAAAGRALYKAGYQDATHGALQYLSVDPSFKKRQCDAVIKQANETLRR